MKENVIVAALCLFCFASFCQSPQAKPLSIGQKLSAIEWQKIPKNKNTQLVVLDFWATTCSSCMDAFPKMQKLQNEFPGTLRVVLVNSWEDESQVRKRLKSINGGRAKAGYNPIVLPDLPQINGDAILKQLFPTQTIPHHVWIDKNGIVKAITYSYNATPEHVRAVLKGDKIDMAVKDDLLAEELAEKGFIQTTDKSIPAPYYSVFMPFVSSLSNAAQKIDSATQTFRRTQYNESILQLIKDAYEEKAERIEIESTEKGIYERPTDGNLIDNWNRKYCFTYELHGPLKDINNWQQTMQVDLNQFLQSKFGIETSVEKRTFKSLILRKTNSLLKTNGADEKYKNQDTIFFIANYPFSEVVNALKDRLENMDAESPFIDETGIDPNLKVDMQLTGDLKNVENVRKQLQQYGLDIIEAEREVEVLVIRDKKKE